MRQLAPFPIRRRARRRVAACAAALMAIAAAPLAQGQPVDGAPPALQPTPDAAISGIGASLERLEALVAPPAQGAPDSGAAPAPKAQSVAAPEPVAAPPEAAPAQVAPVETATAEQRARVAALRARLDALRGGGATPSDPAARDALEALDGRVATLEKEAGAAAWRAQAYARYRDAIQQGGLSLSPALALEGRPERGETRPSIEIAPEIVLVRANEPKAAYASASLNDPAAPLPDGAEILRLGLYRAPGVRLVLGWALGRGQLFTGEQDLAPFAGE